MVRKTVAFLDSDSDSDRSNDSSRSMAMGVTSLEPASDEPGRPTPSRYTRYTEDMLNNFSTLDLTAPPPPPSIPYAGIIKPIFPPPPAAPSLRRNQHIRIEPTQLQLLRNGVQTSLRAWSNAKKLYGVSNDTTREQRLMYRKARVAEKNYVDAMEDAARDGSDVDAEYSAVLYDAVTAKSSASAFTSASAGAGANGGASSSRNIKKRVTFAPDMADGPGRPSRRFSRSRSTYVPGRYAGGWEDRSGCHLSATKFYGAGKHEVSALQETWVDKSMRSFSERMKAREQRGGAAPLMKRKVDQPNLRTKNLQDAFSSPIID